VVNMPQVNRNNGYFKYLEYVPFVSTFTGSKKIIQQLFADRHLKKISNNLEPKVREYKWLCLKNESRWRSFAAMLPFVGNFIVWRIDVSAAKRADRIEEDPSLLLNETVAYQKQFLIEHSAREIEKYLKYVDFEVQREYCIEQGNLQFASDEVQEDYVIKHTNPGVLKFASVDFQVKLMNQDLQYFKHASPEAKKQFIVQCKNDNWLHKVLNDFPSFIVVLSPEKQAEFGVKNKKLLKHIDDSAADFIAKNNKNLILHMTKNKQNRLINEGFINQEELKALNIYKMVLQLTDLAKETGKSGLKNYFEMIKKNQEDGFYVNTIKVLFEVAEIEQIDKLIKVIMDVEMQQGFRKELFSSEVGAEIFSKFYEKSDENVKQELFEKLKNQSDANFEKIIPYLDHKHQGILIDDAIKAQLEAGDIFNKERGLEFLKNYDENAVQIRALDVKKIREQNK